MRYTVKIQMDNAAFEYKALEVISILNTLVSLINENGILPQQTLMDSNGNHVGSAKVTKT